MNLSKLSYEKNHSHVLLTRPDGSGVTSTDKNHYHEILPPTPPTPARPPNPMTGDPGDPGSEGSPASMSPGPNGHTHREAEWSGPKPPAQTEEAKAKEVRILFQTLRDHEAECRKEAREAEEFFAGDQWPKDVRDELTGVGRACLVLNHTASTIDLLSGYQRQNRMDLKAQPIEDSDARVADILNMVFKQIMDQSVFAAEETAQFEDELIVGRGSMELSEEPNDQGEVEAKLRHLPWDAAYFGPHLRPDLADLECMAKTKWYTRQAIEQRWPEKAKDITPEQTSDPDSDDPASNVDIYEKEGTAVDLTAGNTDPDFVNSAKQEYRVVEMIRKEFKQIYLAIDPTSPDTDIERLDYTSAAERKQIQTLPTLKVLPKDSFIMRRTVTAGMVLLEDEYPEWSWNDFPVSNAYGYFRAGEWWGKVRGAMDPQREINKRHSQATDIMNKAANYGYFTDADTFETPADELSFKENASSPGFVQRIRSVEKPPRQQEGTKVPTEILQMETMALDQFRAITNVNEELLGMSSNVTSGVAILERKRQGLVGNERFFDSLSMSKKRLGKMLIAVIQKHYDPERIARIIESNRLPQTQPAQQMPQPMPVMGMDPAMVQGGMPPEMGGMPGQMPMPTGPGMPGGPNPNEPMIGSEPLSAYSREDIIKLLETADLSKFDIAISESSASPTVMNANFQIMTELAKQGLPISPITLLQLAPMPDKARLIAQTQQEMQRMQQIEQGKQQTEIQKTQISANAKMQPKPGNAQPGA